MARRTFVRPTGERRRHDHQLGQQSSTVFDFEKPVSRPPHPAALTDEELLSQCEYIQGRTGGPGGQHRNKVSTGVELTHLSTGVHARASERRTIRENRPVAIRRLRLALATEIRTPVPVGDIRSDLWKSRCRDGRIVCNPSHHDYPSLLAEALDVLEACHWDSMKASSRMCCTASQLHKLIARHPPAWTLLVRRRAEWGHSPLKSPGG